MNAPSLTPLAEAYRRDGFSFPHRALDADAAAACRASLEAYEARSGGPIAGQYRSDVHLLFPWVDELIRHPGILDRVAAILGPDLLCWGCSFFIKEARHGSYVSWHQDATYWGLAPHDQVLTVWLALSDASIESGAMKFLAGSHQQGLHAHEDTFHKDNLLSRGQEIQLDVDESLATDIVLKAGEFSIHHVLMAHGSHPNTSDDRRIGLAMRYIPTSVRQTEGADTAVLVRGTDRHGHFDLLDGPKGEMDAQALANHTLANQRRVDVLMRGTDKRVR